MIDPIDEKRFWSNVRIGTEDECWVWTGAIYAHRTRACYGRFRFTGRAAYAHRVSLELKLGRSIAPGLWALHACDNSTCVNPSHLYEGTRWENERDKLLHGKQRGAKLTVEDVNAIRNDSRSLKEIAAEFGVHETTIYDIKKGRTWTKMGEVMA